MKSRSSKPTIRLVILLIAAGGLLSGCDDGEASTSGLNAQANADKDQETTAVPVQVIQAIHTDIYASYAATAAISSDADAPIVARVAGEVVELLVEEGDRVKAGQVLARLDGQRLRLEMLAAAANLERARKEYARNADLHQRGLVSAALFEGLEYDLAALEASYDLKRLNYGYSNVRATISGVVSSRMIKPGQSVTVGQDVFRITDTSKLTAHLQIPQAELTKFAAGQAATVEVAATPGERFAATIVRISPTIDTRSGTFRATAIVDNAKGDLAPGMFGRFRVTYAKHASALVIPAQAILDEDGEQTVYVVSNGEVTRRSIQTGIKNDGQVEVVGGLTSDEQVVVVGHSGLRDGSKVLASIVTHDNKTG